jgi:ABC-2 type transport system permease protein
MIDGFRYGFFGISDIAPQVSLTVIIGFLALFTAFTLWLLSTGYKLRQ